MASDDNVTVVTLVTVDFGEVPVIYCWIDGIGWEEGGAGIWGKERDVEHVLLLSCPTRETTLHTYPYRQEKRGHRWWRSSREFLWGSCTRTFVFCLNCS